MIKIYIFTLWNTVLADELMAMNVCMRKFDVIMGIPKTAYRVSHSLFGCQVVWGHPLQLWRFTKCIWTAQTSPWGHWWAFKVKVTQWSINQHQKWKMFYFWSIWLNVDLEHSSVMFNVYFLCKYIFLLFSCQSLDLIIWTPLNKPMFVCVEVLRSSQPNGVISSAVSLPSACINGSLGVRDSQKLPLDFQKSMPGSLGLPTLKDIWSFTTKI